MSGTPDISPSQLRPPPRPRIRLSLTDPRFRGLVWQVAILSLVGFIGWFLIRTTNINLDKRHIATGFDFLNRIAGIPITETLVPYDPGKDVYGRAILIGILNTLRVAAIGVVLATLLGTLIGIGRLSPNWLMAKLTAGYVETLRDIPLLLQLLFWYTLLQGLPPPKQAFQIGESFFLSNRGMKYPWPVWTPELGWTLAAVVAGIIVTLIWRSLARARQNATGHRPAVWPVGVIAILVVPAALFFALGAPLPFDVPALRGFNFVGGSSLGPELGALLVGLIVYSSAYIAEIVRAGIEAVPKGQWEAGRALGLRRAILLRRIVMPQALRVIVPPLTSQYLNLVKNSSLAIAIGYQDIVSVASTTFSQTGQAIEGILIIMLVYLTFSLSISLFMNWYNARIALVER